MTWIDDQLRADLQNGFIDGSLPAGALGPEILTNRQGNTIFNEIKMNCAPARILRWQLPLLHRPF